MQSPSLEQKIHKKVFLFQVLAFELGVANSPNIQQDTCHQQTMCQQTHQGFRLRLGETFSKSTSLRKLKIDEKCALMRISQVFGTISHVHCESFF